VAVVTVGHTGIGLAITWRFMADEATGGVAAPLSEI
jgi:hypothetical protein